MLKALAKDLPIMSDGEIEPGPEKWVLLDEFEVAWRSCELALLREPYQSICEPRTSSLMPWTQMQMAGSMSLSLLRVRNDRSVDSSCSYTLPQIMLSAVSVHWHKPCGDGLL